MAILSKVIHGQGGPLHPSGLQDLIKGRPEQASLADRGA
jgi:hypothetical protein